MICLARRRIPPFEKHQIGAGDRWQEIGHVFTSTAPLDDCNVTHQFQRILEAAELPRLPFHDLRHTCATLLIAQGVYP